MLWSAFCFSLNLSLLYCISLCFSLISRFPFFYTFPISLSATMLFYYFATFFGLLFFAKVTFTLIGFLSFCYIIKQYSKGNRFTFNIQFLFLTLLFLSFLFANADIVGDDYTAFWAKLTKYAHINSTYWGDIIGSTQHSSYTPGFALLSTMCNGLFAYLPESQYFSCCLPLIVLSCSVYQTLPATKHWSISFATIFIAIFSIKTLGCVNPVNYLNVDYAIAAFFSATLIVAILEENLNRAHIFLLFSLPGLTLLKITCFPMALVVIALFGVRCYFEQKSYCYALVQSLKLLLICLFVLICWFINLDIQGLHDRAFSISLKTLQKMISIYSLNINNITTDLLDYIFIKPCLFLFPKQLSFLTSSFALLMWAAVCLLYCRKTRKLYAIYTFILVSSTLLWFALNLYIIAIALPDDARVGIMADTYPRYVGAFVCAIFLPTMLTLFQDREIYQKIPVQHAKILCNIIIVCLPIYVAGVFIRSHPEFGSQHFEKLKLNVKYYSEYQAARRISDMLLERTENDCSIAICVANFDRQVARSFALRLEPKRKITTITECQSIPENIDYFLGGVADNSYSRIFTAEYGALYKKIPLKE